MKSTLLAAAWLICVAGTARASDERFELRLDERRGGRMIAATNLETGAFAIAAGRDNPSILTGDEARVACANVFDVQRSGFDPARKKAAERREIVVHRMDYRKNPDDGRARPVIRNDRNLEDERRLIILGSANAPSAAKFIDAMKGPGAREKIALKTSAGL